ncbi:MAG: hypothetical protein BYD32DRAFT_412269 [Podila humilis]|nr:MAG: hypothetical protein BYD32DRAFT_412269 [Podila humilis]
MPTYPTPVRIWKTHLSYKNSSLLYLPRIQKYLQDFSIPYNIRIAIIDILIKSKETQRYMVISELEGYMSQLKSTTRPPLPEEINIKRQKFSHPKHGQHPSYSAIVLPSNDTDTFDMSLRPSTDFHQVSLSTILEEIYSSFRQQRSFHSQRNYPHRTLSEIIHLFSTGRIHEAAYKLQLFSQHDAFHIIAQGVNSLLFVRHHNTAFTTDASKLALDCLFALGIPSHTYPVPALYPALDPALPAPTLLCRDSQSHYMWTPAHYQPEFTNVWFSRAFEAYHIQPRVSHNILLRGADALGALLCYDSKVKVPPPPLSKRKPSQGPHFLRQKYDGSCLSVALCSFVISNESSGVLGAYLQNNYTIGIEKVNPCVLSLHNFSFLSTPSSENTGGGDGSANHIILLLPYNNALWEVDGQAEDGLRYIGPCGNKHWTSLAKERADQWNEQCKAINSDDFIDIHVIVSSPSSSSNSAA